jgi:uncharacterized protein involved in exopolysaccharide biosynthesis
MHERPDAVTSTALATRSVQEPQELSLFDLLNALLLHRRAVLLLPLLFFATALLYSISQPRTWTSAASFIPQQAGAAAAPWAGVAAQFGFNMPGTEAAESPAFYAELMRSHAILGAALDSTFEMSGAGGREQATLVHILIPREMPAGQRRDEAFVELRAALQVGIGRETGLISYSVTTPDPLLSRDLAALLLRLVNEFNMEKRQFQAAAERRFVEDRLTQARGELRESEAALRQFQEANRRFMESPQLSLVHSRLQHDMILRQQIVTSLAEAFERARIDEVRNLPLITTIDEPRAPVRPNARGTVVRGLVALMLGFGLAVAYALLRTSMDSRNTSSRPDAQLFRQLSSEALAGLRPSFTRRTDAGRDSNHAAHSSATGRLTPHAGQEHDR